MRSPEPWVRAGLEAGFVGEGVADDGFVGATDGAEALEQFIQTPSGDGARHFVVTHPDPGP